MAGTVYLLGAGTNQVVSHDWMGLDVRPPLANNFFQMVLRLNKFRSQEWKIPHTLSYSQRFAPVYQYISHIWKRNKHDLLIEPFNLEDCYTMIQLQQKEANRKKDYEELERLNQIGFLLSSSLAEYLQEFQKTAVGSDIMKEFGEVLYREKPTVLTLNYDAILESAITWASPVNPRVYEYSRKLMREWAEWAASEKFKEPGTEPDLEKELPDDELPYSANEWNLPLAYGIKFDEVEIDRPGWSRYVKGNRFYNHPQNKLYSWRILKLHGSLNWFQYTGTRTYSPFDTKLPVKKLREVLLVRGQWWLGRPPNLRGWLLKPLIITPVLYKEEYYQHPVFIDIWSQAREKLSTCKRLVVIGYSFAPTDFYVRKLFLDAFCGSRLEELVIVNPDTSVVRTVKELSHFQKPVLVCQDLEEYLRGYTH